jgi:hypothetical protein
LTGQPSSNNPTAAALREEVNMKRLRIVILAVLAVVLPAVSQAASHGFARISLIQGDVQVRNEDVDDWVPAALNTPLREGDSVWCPEDARAELQFRDGTVVRLDRRSALDIVSLDDDLMQFHQGMGRIYVRSGRHADERTLQVDLPATTIRVSNKARFRVDIAADGDEEISIFRGAIYAESMGTKTRLRTGEMLTIDEDSSDISPLKPSDEFQEWNEGRDTRVEKRKSTQYVPPELEAYSSDLDANGEWVSDTEYGYVWRPTAVVVDWSPYRVGRWVWIGGEYVWISSEPWGWAPYHYGRWIHHPHRGWCWVPPTRGEVFWAPGYVGWVTTPTYVGWVPLAPGETYYGRGYYGRHSVNVINVNVNVTNVVYRNVRVNNAVTVVNRKTFVSGRTEVVRPRENIFIKRDGAPGPPRMRPERTAVMPALRKVPESKLPPPQIRQIRARELKERLPIVQSPPRSQGRPDRLERKPSAGSAPGALGQPSPQRGPENRERRERPDAVSAPKPRESVGNVPAPTVRPPESRPAAPERGVVAPVPPQRSPERATPPVEERRPVLRQSAPQQQEVSPQREQRQERGAPQQNQQIRRDQGGNAPAQVQARPAAKPREIRKVWNVRQKEAPPERKKEQLQEKGK